MADTEPVSYFSRRPYTVTYFKDGEKKTVKRQPPPALHNMLPTDIVELERGKNDDFTAGEEFTIKSVNPRNPNVIQIEDGDGNATFVEYFDLKLEEMVAPRHGMNSKDSPKNNRYLLWP